jgi:DNA-directed RNA polymerase sigma subunit (sigma70/sigma32)
MKDSIDLGLAILSVLRAPGEELTHEDIAAWCDCDHETIAQIERRALAKLRVKAKQAGIDLLELVKPPD